MPRKSAPLFLAAVVLLAIAITARTQQGAGPKKMWDGVYTAAQAARGKPNFDLSCSRCHNVALIGSERRAAIKGAAFLSHWDKDTIAGIFTKIRDTMPPLNAEHVSVATKVDIISYLLLANGFPAGSTELTTEEETLDGIQIVRKGAESTGAPNFALVQVVGCLTQTPANRWALTKATEPIVTKEEISTPASMKAAAAANPLGAQTVDLVSVHLQRREI